MNAQTKTTTIRSICPRCRSAETGILSRSPDKDVWIVNGCKVCLYAWPTRSRKKTPIRIGTRKLSGWIRPK
jgi:hypothetical protein